MAADGTSIKSDIDTNLANKGYRGIRIVNVITALKNVVDWVTTAINGNLGVWNKAGTTNPGGSNTDIIYHQGRTVIGRTTDDNSGAVFQVEGSSTLKGGLLAVNNDGTMPDTSNAPGNATVKFLGNWGIPGYSDFAFVNTNLASVGIGFWRMVNATTAQIQLFLRSNGRVGVGTLNPDESLHVVGRVKSRGFVMDGSMPTIAKGVAVGSSPGDVSFSADSNDTLGTLVIQTGASPQGNAVVATINLAEVRPKGLKMFLMATNPGAGPNLSKLWYATNSGSIQIWCGPSPLDANAYLTFNYFILC